MIVGERVIPAFLGDLFWWIIFFGPFATGPKAHEMCPGSSAQGSKLITDRDPTPLEVDKMLAMENPHLQ